MTGLLTASCLASGGKGPRVLDFALLLQYGELPLNDLITSILDLQRERPSEPTWRSSSP